MAEDHEDADPTDGRDETATERLDRNWNALLQELRVVQTGTQLLTGFLLTVAFQQTFRDLEDWQRVLYLVAVSLAVLSTVCALMPVALHRALFRRRAMRTLVAWGDRMARLGMAFTGLAIAAALALVFSVATGAAGAIAVAVVGVVVIALAWAALPIGLRRRAGEPHDPDGPARGSLRG
jgi:ABC-type Fe3+ transport system permease subunit